MILDFGCGTGRTLVHFADEAEAAQFWGCDIDAASIRWAQANLSPPFHFVANAEEPPLGFPPATFDLVYGVSVFTHLAGGWAQWLREIHRLLKVGGYAVFTFLGEGMIREVAGREWDEGRVGMIALDVGRSWSRGGPNVLHSEWWLRRHWGRLFEVVTVRPAIDLVNKKGHGLIVLRKDARVPPSHEDLVRIDSNDPREIASLQFNIELLHERTTAMVWNRLNDGGLVGAAQLRPSRFIGALSRETRKHIRMGLKQRLVGGLAKNVRDPWPSVGGDTWWDDHLNYAANEVISFFAGDGVSLEGREIADIGAGDGIIDLGLVLKARPTRLVGYDIVATDTEWLADQARKRRVVTELPTNLEFAQSEATRIPAPDASFDLVVTWSAFEHVSNPPEVLREIRRILRPDGLLFLQLWPFYNSEHGGHLWEWFPGESFVALRYSRAEVYERMRANPQGEPNWVERRFTDYDTLNRITLNDLQAALIGAGFEIRKVELLTNPVHLPQGMDRKFPLSDLMIAGVKLIAAPE